MNVGIAQSGRDDVLLSPVNAAAFEAMRHPEGGSTDVALPRSMSPCVRRLRPVAPKHLAHTLFHRHGLPIRTSRFIGDSQCVGHGILSEHKRSQLPVEPKKFGELAIGKRRYKRAPECAYLISPSDRRPRNRNVSIGVHTELAVVAALG
jgi:hypothetical protein